MTANRSQIRHGECSALYETVKRHLKAGRLDARLLARAEDLNHALDALQAHAVTAADQILYYRGRSAVAEILDYFGRYRDAAKAAEDGGRLWNSYTVMAAPSTLSVERTILREQVLLMLHYAQSRYRAHRYTEAKEVIDDCRKFVTHIRDPSFPCHGTLGQLMYYLGRVYRQLNLYDESERAFSEAIHQYYCRARQKSDEHRDEPTKAGGEIQFSKYKIAICSALGLGWVAYTRGALTKALHTLIEPAQLVLSETQDNLNIAYARLITGSIVRCLSRREDRARMEEATALVRGAYESFGQHGHTAYRIRAGHELVLTLLYMKAFEQARQYLNEIRLLLEAAPDVRWICNSWILESRLVREGGNYKKAERHASEALRLAESKDQRLCQIDALIARSEARVLLRDAVSLAAARRDLYEGLDLNTTPGGRKVELSANPKIAAVCHLRLARADFRSGHIRDARSHFQRWEEIKGLVEHAGIHALAREVGSELGKEHDEFVIRPEEDTLNYRIQNKRLQMFLLRQALARSASGLKGAAGILAVSRPTVTSWQKMLRKKRD